MIITLSWLKNHLATPSNLEKIIKKLTDIGLEVEQVKETQNELEEMLRMVRANGWDRNLTANQQFKIRKANNIISEFDSKYTFYDLGFNFRPTEITGFLGLSQLEFLVKNILQYQSLILPPYILMLNQQK